MGHVAPLAFDSVRLRGLLRAVRSVTALHHPRLARPVLVQGTRGLIGRRIPAHSLSKCAQKHCQEQKSSGSHVTTGRTGPERCTGPPISVSNTTITRSPYPSSLPQRSLEQRLSPPFPIHVSPPSESCRGEESATYERSHQRVGRKSRAPATAEVDGVAETAFPWENRSVTRSDARAPLGLALFVALLLTPSCERALPGELLRAKTDQGDLVLVSSKRGKELVLDNSSVFDQDNHVRIGNLKDLRSLRMSSGLPGQDIDLCLSPRQGSSGAIHLTGIDATDPKFQLLRNEVASSVHVIDDLPTWGGLALKFLACANGLSLIATLWWSCYRGRRPFDRLTLFLPPCFRFSIPLNRPLRAELTFSLAIIGALSLETDRNLLPIRRAENQAS